MSIFKTIVVIFMVILMTTGPARAECYQPAAAQALVARREAIPLTLAMRSISQYVGSFDLLDAKFCKINSKYHYYLKVLLKNGRVLTFDIDATNGNVIGY